MNLVTRIVLAAMLLLIRPACGVAAWPGGSGGLDASDEQVSDLAGVYELSIAGDLSVVARMRITGRSKTEFDVGIAEPTGDPSVDWTGRGTFKGSSGHYDWTFPDGKTGRTTLSIDADGRLLGQVRGAGIDWDYMARRTPASGGNARSH